MPNDKGKKANITIDEGFESWNKILLDLERTATKSFMPLLATSLKLSKEILETYEKAFRKLNKE